MASRRRGTGAIWSRWQEERGQRARAGPHRACDDQIRKQETERTAAAQATLDLEYKLESETYAAGVQVDVPKSWTTPSAASSSRCCRSARSTVGDIVHVDEGESARAVAVTAEMIEAGRANIGAIEKALKKVKEADKRQKATGALGMLKDWDAQVAKLRRLAAAPARLLRHSSPLLPHIEKVKALCQASGARLVLLVLPLDVMVSDTEWAKYGAKPQDMSATAVLVDDLDARQRGDWRVGAGCDGGARRGRAGRVLEPRPPHDTQGSRRGGARAGREGCRNRRRPFRPAPCRKGGPASVTPTSTHAVDPRR